MMTLELHSRGLLAQPSLMVLQSSLMGLHSSLIVQFNSGLSSLFLLVGWPFLLPVIFLTGKIGLSVKSPRTPYCLFC